MPNSDTQATDLLAAVSAHCAGHKGEYLDKITAVTKDLMLWLGHLHSTISRRIADRLLDAAQAAIIETAGCLSLGLVRPAIFSIRAQLELVLAWIYFNDHPVEWARFEKNLRDYQLPAVAIRYLVNNSDRYQDRFKLLAEKKHRSSEDPYSILSTHVHSNSTYSAPSIGPLSALVRGPSTCDEGIKLEAEVAEYVTDVLASWYADRWHDFPPQLAAKLKARLGPSKLKQFCS